MNSKKFALYRSYGFWVSVIAAVILVLKSILNGYGIKIEEKYLSDIADGVLGLLIVLGVIAAPKAPKDDQTDGGDFPVIPGSGGDNPS